MKPREEYKAETGEPELNLFIKVNGKAVEAYTDEYVEWLEKKYEAAFNAVGTLDDNE